MKTLFITFILLSSSAFANCRLHETCIKSQASCDERETSIDEDFVYGNQLLEAELVDIFMCSTPIGDFYPQKFPNNVSKIVSSKVSHDEDEADLSRVDPSRIEAAIKTAKRECELKAQKYNALKSCK